MENKDRIASIPYDCITIQTCYFTESQGGELPCNADRKIATLYYAAAQDADKGEGVIVA